LFDIAPLEASVAESISTPRFAAGLLALFGAGALLLALIGVHGLLNYTVTQRFQEVGIRMALGAERSRITWEVVGEGLKLTLAGLALGIPGALAASGLLRGMVYGVTPTDPLTYGVVAVAVLVAALSASAIPAWRASRADPLTALRAE
jgi:ABC-type antimicrobial peptide transport system permease subunit